MADNKFKRALDYAFNQEMDEMPALYELESRYSFSSSFETKMDQLIASVKKKYMTVFGISFSRYTIGVLLMILAAVIIAGMMYRNVINYSQARFIFAASELVLLTIFGISTRKISYNMTRTLQTGFADYEEDETVEDYLEFAVPIPPENYSKTNEYRTTTDHTVEYTDTAGRVIKYSRIDIRTGVLPKIETPDKINATKIGQWEAVWFIKDGLTNLVWADKKYRYQLTGSCNMEKLIKMAESI